MFLHRCSHTQSLRAFTQRAFAPKTRSTRKQTFRRRSFHTQKLFAHTHKLLTPVRCKDIALFPPFSGSTRVSFREWSMKEKPNRDFALIWTIGRRFAWEGRFGARPFFLLADARFVPENFAESRFTSVFDNRHVFCAGRLHRALAERQKII